MSTITPSIKPIQLEQATTSSTVLPKHVTTKDSLQKSEELDSFFHIPLTKPTLASPEWRLIQNIDDLNEITEQGLSINQSQINHHMEKLKELSQEHLRLFKEGAEKNKSNKWWGELHQMVSCLAATFSTLCGVSAAAGGSTLIAGALIASGVMAISNVALSSTGAWDKMARELYPEDLKKREQFKTFAPLMLAAASTTLGMAGGAAAYSTGAVVFAEKMTQTISSTVHAVEGVTSVGQGYAKADAHLTEAKVKNLDIQMFTNEHELQQYRTAFESMIQTLSDATMRTADILKLSTHMTTQMLQG